MRSKVHHIIDSIGPEVIASRLGLSEFSIRAAKRERKFPSSWYASLHGLCSEAGIECPLEAFRWREPPQGRGTA